MILDKAGISSPSNGFSVGDYFYCHKHAKFGMVLKCEGELMPFHDCGTRGAMVLWGCTWDDIEHACFDEATGYRRQYQK